MPQQFKGSKILTDIIQQLTAQNAKRDATRRAASVSNVHTPATMAQLIGLLGLTQRYVQASDPWYGNMMQQVRERERTRPDPHWNTPARQGQAPWDAPAPPRR